MNAVIETHISEVRRLCEKYRVKRLELCGSATGPGFDPSCSDLDFLVEFLELEEGEYADAYFGMLEELESLFGRHVDLVMPEAVRNRFFLESIQASRDLLYAV